MSNQTDFVKSVPWQMPNASLTHAPSLKGWTFPKWEYLSSVDSLIEMKSTIVYPIIKADLDGENSKYYIHNKLQSLPNSVDTNGITWTIDEEDGSTLKEIDNYEFFACLDNRDFKIVRNLWLYEGLKLKDLMIRRNYKWEW